jgi:cell filamentation protein
VPKLPLINVLHPFNEENGRTLRLFFDMIVTYNGYEYINYEEALENNEYINVSIDCMIADCEKIKNIITKGLKKLIL